MRLGTDFSGIGAPEMALKYLGINHESVFACEIDKYARQSFQQLHNPKTFYNDITKRNHKEVEQLDLYVAGFPCQSFSMAGKRKGFDEARGTLFFNVAEFIQINQPKVFVLENVKGLVNHNGGKTFQTIIDILSNGGGTVNGQMGIDNIDGGLGYHIYYKVLNTRDYGIPQNRERIFIVGFKDFRSFRFPKAIPLDIKLKDILQDNADSKYMISKKGLDVLKKHQKFNKFSTIDASTDYAQCITARCNKVSNDNNFIEVDDKYYLSDKAINRIKRHNNKTLKKDISTTIHAGYYKGGGRDQQYVTSHSLYPRCGDPKKGGTGHLSKSDGTSYCLDTGNSQAIELRQIGNIADKGNFDNPQRGRVYDADGLSPCLGAVQGGGIQPKTVINNKIRRLTPLECFRLQGFKDEDFYKVKDVSDTQLYKQAGNSITVDVLMHLFKKIYA
jgi:DNA (cytosine-5)-methyltransferase 1